MSELLNEKRVNFPKLFVSTADRKDDINQYIQRKLVLNPHYYFQRFFLLSLQLYLLILLLVGKL